MMIADNFIHFIKFLFKIDQPRTQTTLEEQEAILKYAKGAINAVEIGVFEGYNTALIAYAMADAGRLYAIDPFFTGRLGISWQKLIATNYLNRKRVKNRVTLLEEKSETAVSKILIDPDFIFVDGDHSWEGINTDWKLYSSLLRKGGVIALHDTAVPSFQGWKSEMDSVKYFQEYIQSQPGFELLEIVDSLSILRKL